MRIIRHFFVWVILFFISFFSASALFFHFYGKSIFEEQLTDLLGHKITIVKMRYHFPWGFRIDNFQISDSLRMPKIVFYVSPLDLLKRKITITDMKIYNPFIILKNNPEKKDAAQLSPDSRQFEQFWQEVKHPYEENNVRFSIQHIEIYNLQFLTYLTLWDAKKTVECSQVNVIFNDFQWPFKHGDEADFQAVGNLTVEGIPSYSHFKMTAAGIWALADDRFQSDINVNSFGDNLDVLLKLSVENAILKVQGKGFAKNVLESLNLSPQLADMESVLKEASLKNYEIGTDFDFQTPLDMLKVDKINFSIEVKKPQTVSAENNNP